MRRLLALGLLLATTPLSAQEGIPWRASYFPYLIGNPTTGLMLIGHYHFARQSDFESRAPFDGIFSVEAGWSTNNSRFVNAKFRAPQLVPGWRFTVDAGAGREGTFGYFGEGPDGSNENFQPDPVFSDEFFRMRRTRYFIRGEVTRRIVGPLSVAASAGYAHFKFSSSLAGSLFDNDYLNTPLGGSDATGRITLVLDTRDNELVPANGALLEAGLYGGTGRFESRNLSPQNPDPASFQPSFTESGYVGGYLHLRGYVSPRGGTVVAGRLAARDMGASAPLDARYILPGWEREVSVMGGAESHRSFVPGRYVGRGLLLGSLEVRHNLLDLASLGAVTVIGFVDGGRVFGDGFKWTTKRWKVGGGGALAIRVLQSAPLLLNFAGGPEGFRFTMSNGWAF